MITAAEIPLVPPLAKGETEDSTAIGMQSEFMRLPCGSARRRWRRVAAERQVGHGIVAIADNAFTLAFQMTVEQGPHPGIGDPV